MPSPRKITIGGSREVSENQSSLKINYIWYEPIGMESTIFEIVELSCVSRKWKDKYMSILPRKKRGYMKIFISKLFDNSLKKWMNERIMCLFFINQKIMTFRVKHIPPWKLVKSRVILSKDWVLDIFFIFPV